MKTQINVKHHHRIVPVILITFGAPIALAVGFLLIANILFHDEKPPEDSALRLSDVSVPIAQNAYYDIQRMNDDVMAVDPQATQPLTDTKVDSMLSGGAWDEAYAIEVAKKYVAATNDFRQAATKERYQDPIGAHPNSLDVNSFSGSINNLRFVAKLVALEGLRQVKSGDTVNGLTEVMDIVRLGHRMETSQATIIEVLVGSATKQIGISALRQISLQSAVTADQAKTVSQELEAYRDERSGLVTAMKMEYAYSRSYTTKQLDLGQVYDGYFLVTNSDGNVVPRSTTGKTISLLDATGLFHYYYWPNQSWRFLVDQRMLDLQSVQADCATGNLFPSRSASYSQRTGFGRLLEPNTIGKLIADIGNVTLGSVVIKACNESLAVSATQTTLAVSAYRHDNQKLPDALEALVPNYLPSVPIDPYNNKALVYEPAKKSVYSVGSNRIDESGNVAADSALYPNAESPWQTMLDPKFVVTR